MAPVWNTVVEKEQELKVRRLERVRLGQNIDKRIKDASTDDSERVDCGGTWVCSAVQNMACRLGLLSKKNTQVAAVAAVASVPKAVGVKESAKGVSGRMGTSLFGMPVGKKQKAAGKLQAATTAMRARVEDLDRRATTGKSASMEAMKAGNKQLAMRELRRAKTYEKQAASTQSALDAVEAQSDMLQQTALQREVASALDATAQSLKKDKGLVSKTEDAVEAAAEMRDFHEDLTHAMAGLGEVINNEYDDDDLMQELEGMMTDNPADPPRVEAISVSQEECVRQEQNKLQQQTALYDEAEKIRRGMPTVPTTSTIKRNTPSKGSESTKLLAQ